MSQIISRKLAQDYKIAKDKIDLDKMVTEIVEKIKKDRKAQGIIDVNRRSNMPQIGSKKYPFDVETGKVLAEDLMPKGEHILKKDGKWVHVQEALRGALIKKGTKLAYKLATKKFPTLFKKKRFSIAELKAKKIKTPELASLGVTKTTADNLRKLSVAEVTKNRLTHLGNLAIKHQRKAVSLFWGKAKNFNQIEKLEKYHMLATKKKLTDIGKQYANLTKYQETIKAKTATKHSEGGEVVISKNVDRSLL